MGSVAIRTPSFLSLFTRTDKKVTVSGEKRVFLHPCSLVVCSILRKNRLEGNILMGEGDGRRLAPSRPHPRGG